MKVTPTRLVAGITQAAPMWVLIGTGASAVLGVAAMALLITGVVLAVLRTSTPQRLEASDRS